ncbi:Psmd10, partial [Symbiodinium sp. KB8]
MFQHFEIDKAAPAPKPPPPALAAYMAQVARYCDESSDEDVVDFDERLKEECRLLQEAATTVRLILRTGVFRFLPHVHVAEKQLNAIASKLDEVTDLLSPHNMFWRFGRDQPMKQLLETPLLQLAASSEVIVPVTAGMTSELGEGLVARFLVSGTDASKSRYREFSSGILDSVQRELLMMRLEWLFHSTWDLPLTWGDGLDDMSSVASQMWRGSRWDVYPSLYSQGCSVYGGVTDDRSLELEAPKPGVTSPWEHIQRTATVKADLEDVGTLKRRAEMVLEVGKGQLVSSSGGGLDVGVLSVPGCRMDRLKNVQQIQANGRAIQPLFLPMDVQQIQANGRAFAAILGDSSTVVWGNARLDGDSRAAQARLKNGQQIQASRAAFADILGSAEASARVFAAILADGSVVTRGRGDSSAAQHQLKNVQQIQDQLKNVQQIQGIAGVVTWALEEEEDEEVENVDIYIADEVTTWHLALHFPPEAPFTGGSGCVLKASSFSLYATLTFGPDFPARPPKFKFESKWINHQHLWGDRICHSLLSDDFLDFFRERRTHSTSLWNASCALSDEEGLGGMPRYLQILREFLGCDSDYDEEQHVKYDASSLEADVATQRSFKPEWWEESSRLEPEASAATPPEAEAAQSKE